MLPGRSAEAKYENIRPVVIEEFNALFFIACYIK